MSGAATPEAPSIGKQDVILLSAGAALFALLYIPVLVKLVNQWIIDENYRHGFLIPFVSILMLWRRRDELRAAKGGGGEVFGLLIIVFASVLLVGGTAASEFFTARLSLPFFILGASLTVMGKNFTLKAAFPVLFLIMMIPLPYIIYYKVTFPLQLLSAKLSAGVLNTITIEVVRRGNMLLLPNYTLEVVAACSGLRSLMTMFTLALIMAAFTELSNIKKLVLVAAAIPVAIVANTFRLVVTAIGAYVMGSEFADGVIHTISGLIVFIAGFIMLLVIMGMMRWIK